MAKKEKKKSPKKKSPKREKTQEPVDDLGKGFAKVNLAKEDDVSFNHTYSMMGKMGNLKSSHLNLGSCQATLHVLATERGRRRVKFEAMCGGTEIQDATIENDGMSIRFKVLRSNMLLTAHRTNVLGAALAIPIKEETAFDDLKQQIFSENPEFRVKGCPWTWERILLPFKCKKNFVQVPTMIPYLHDNDIMRDLGQYIWIYSCTAEEDKDVWAGKQETHLDATVEALLQARRRGL